MFKYHILALCEKPVGDVLNPYFRELTPSQIRKRKRQSFATLKVKIACVPSVVEIIEREEQGCATIFTTDDVSEYLKEQDIFAIKIDEPRKFPIGAQHLFYIRATLCVSQNDREIIARLLKQNQEKISRIIQEEFSGSEGPYPFTYFVAGDPDSRWLPSPFDRKNDWLVQLRKIEAKLLENDICVEIGIKRMPV